MKTIKSLKDITTLEVDDVVMFGNLKYIVTQGSCCKRYYLVLTTDDNDKIFKVLNINKIDFIEKLGINAKLNCSFPETKSLEALTAIVSALFKEYEKQNELPKTWEEFCKMNPIKDVKYYISVNSDIEEIHYNMERHSRLDRNVCNSKQEAEAHLALMQLRQLRKAYVGNWEPNWHCRQLVHCVGYNYILNKCVVESSCVWGNCMSFPTEELAKQFLTNFKDLLEIAKPLL